MSRRILEFIFYQGKTIVNVVTLKFTLAFGQFLKLTNQRWVFQITNTCWLKVDN